MTPLDRFERELPAALLDVAGTGAPDYLSDILGRTARTRQRPAWASLERWLPMDLANPRAATARIPWRAIGVLALVALLVGALLVAYAGSQRRVPAPFGPAANGVIPFDKGGDIFVGDPVTGATRLVIGGLENDHSVSFSSDGTKVAFLRTTSAGDQIVVADADGTNVRVMTPTPLENLTLAWWMPTSDGLIIDHAVGGVQRLEVLGIEGGSRRVLAEDLPADNVAFRPPDGTEFVVRAEVGGAWGLYSMRVDGSAPRLLAPATATAGLPDQDLNSATYSADGTRITYNRYVPGTADTPEAIQLWTMNADGSDQRRFNPDGPQGSWEGEALSSPDGRWLAAYRVPQGGASHIAIFAADGSGEPHALANSEDGGTWVWAPDSTKLLVNPFDTSEGQRLYDPTSGVVTALPWNQNSEPDWQRVAP